MKPLVLALSSGLAGGLMAAVGVVTAQRFIAPAPVFVSVRVEELITAQVKGLSAQLDDPAQRAVAAERFARALDAELDNVAKDYGAVVFASGAVMRGATDLTVTVRSRLEARLATPEGPKP